jgi:hypothetical protein
VSLAGTSLSSPILGSVVFDVTFLNEVTRQHGTIRDIGAQVLDELIIPRSKPDLSQPVEPATTPVTSKAERNTTVSLAIVQGAKE